MVKNKIDKERKFEYSFSIAPQNCGIRESDLKEFWYCYKNDIRAKYARALFLFGYEQFKRTYWYENLDELRFKVKKIDENCEHPNFQELNEFNYNYISDSIKICLCFENFFKYKLLQKGYSIHIIDKNSTYKDLDLNKPVEIIKLLKLNSFNEFDIQQKIPKMRKNTYSLSTMLNNNNDFNTITKIPSKFLGFLSDLNKTRNNLHNLFALTGKISLERIDIMMRMDKFLQAELDDEMNYNDYLISQKIS